jgi:cell division protein FtsB
VANLSQVRLLKLLVSMAAAGLEAECGAALKEFMEKVQRAVDAHTAAYSEKLLLREKALEAFEKQLKDRERTLDERAKAFNLSAPEECGVAAAPQVKAEEASVPEPALNMPTPARAGAHADATSGISRAVLRMDQYGQRTATAQPQMPTTLTRPLPNMSITQSPRQAQMTVSPSQRPSWAAQSVGQSTPVGQSQAVSQSPRAAQSQAVGQSPRISATSRPPLSPPAASAASKPESVVSISARKEKLIAALHKNTVNSSVLDDSSVNCSMVSTPGRAPPVSGRHSLAELLKEDEEKLAVAVRNSIATFASSS